MGVKNGAKKCVPGCTCGKHATYPRVCHNGHTINGREDLYSVGRGGTALTCKLCRRITCRQYYQDNIERERASRTAYAQTPEGRAAHIRANDNYRASTKGLLSRARQDLARAYNKREGLL